MKAATTGRGGVFVFSFLSTGSKLTIRTLLLAGLLFTLLFVVSCDEKKTTEQLEQDTSMAKIQAELVEDRISQAGMQADSMELPADNYSHPQEQLNQTVVPSANTTPKNNNDEVAVNATTVTVSPEPTQTDSVVTSEVIPAPNKTVQNKRQITEQLTPNQSHHIAKTTTAETTVRGTPNAVTKVDSKQHNQSKERSTSRDNNSQTSNVMPHYTKTTDIIDSSEIVDVQAYPKQADKPVVVSTQDIETEAEANRATVAKTVAGDLAEAVAVASTLRQQSNKTPPTNQTNLTLAGNGSGSVAPAAQKGSVQPKSNVDAQTQVALMAAKTRLLQAMTKNQQFISNMNTAQKIKAEKDYNAWIKQRDIACQQVREQSGVALKALTYVECLAEKTEQRSQVFKKILASS